MSHTNVSIIEAVQKGAMETVSSLLKSGVDPNTCTRLGLSLLHIAALRDEANIMQALLSRGAVVNTPTAWGSTGLHLAAHKGSVENVKILLLNGAGPNVVDDNGDTPLHLAACEGHADVVKSLLEHGAQTSVKNSAGLLAQDEAIQCGNPELAAFLSNYPVQAVKPATPSDSSPLFKPPNSLEPETHVPFASHLSNSSMPPPPGPPPNFSNSMFSVQTEPESFSSLIRELELEDTPKVQLKKDPDLISQYTGAKSMNAAASFSFLPDKQSHPSDESSPQGPPSNPMLPPPPSGPPQPGFPPLYSCQQGRLPPTSQTSSSNPPNSLYFDKNHNNRQHNPSSDLSSSECNSPLYPGNKDSPYSPGKKDSPYSPVNKEDISPYSAPYNYNYSSSKISLDRSIGSSIDFSLPSLPSLSLSKLLTTTGFSSDHEEQFHFEQSHFKSDFRDTYLAYQSAIGGTPPAGMPPPPSGGMPPAPFGMPPPPSGLFPPSTGILSSNLDSVSSSIDSHILDARQASDTECGGVSSLTDLTPQFSDIDLTPKLGMQSDNETVYTKPESRSDEKCPSHRRWPEEDSYIKEASKISEIVNTLAPLLSLNPPAKVRLAAREVIKTFLPAWSEGKRNFRQCGSKEKEWKCGEDYALVSDKPLNIGFHEREGSCSLIFKILHGEWGTLVLKMMVNLLNQGEHDKGQSGTVSLWKRFSAEHTVPLSLPYHPNVVQILHCYNSTTAPFKRFLPLLVPPELDVAVDMASRTSFMVMIEYPFSLKHFVNKFVEYKARFCSGGRDRTEKELQMMLLILLQCLLSLHHLHNNNVVHRDIKLDNFMMNLTGQVVLIDFGLAISLVEGEQNVVAMDRNDIIAGNPQAWAPEITQAHHNFTPGVPLCSVYSRSDVYTLGKVFVDIFEVFGFVEKSATGSVVVPPSLSHMPLLCQAVSLIDQMCVVDVDSRVGTESALLILAYNLFLSHCTTPAQVLQTILSLSFQTPTPPTQVTDITTLEGISALRHIVAKSLFTDVDTDKLFDFVEFMR